MSLKRFLFLCSLLLVSTSAQAIPPPDVFISLWQSILQTFGIVSVFLVSAYYSVKQFFGYTFIAWKRPLFLSVLAISLIAVVVGPYMHFFNADLPTQTIVTNQTIPLTTPSTKIPTHPTSFENTPIIEGKRVAIETILKRETDEYTRDWKLATYREMLQETEWVRTKAKLEKLQYTTITSFTPKALQKLLQQNAEQLFLLDVRGAYERKMFRLSNKTAVQQASVHYGDLLNDIITEPLASKLPKNKRIVVICHSGLRGYFAANLLRQMGHQNVAFLQGGLAHWNQQKLPMIGDENYSEYLGIYPVLSRTEAHALTNALKIEIDPGKGFVEDINGLLEVPFETSPSKKLKFFIEQSKSKPILMTCRGYGGCFHTLNFGYLIEQGGGKIAGVFDRTGQYIIAPIIE